MATPNWIIVSVLKSELYLKISGTDYDTLLTTLGEQITARMISYLNTATYTDAPTGDLVRAAHMQANYEWRQRAYPGLSSVQHQDGSVSKYQTEEWLEEVRMVLDRNRYYTIYPTT